jgi:FixJ family two-component response regulator
LTPREQQVLDFVVDGELNKRIAHNLGLSEKTVEFHRSNIMKKLEAKSLAELVRKSIVGNSS